MIYQELINWMQKQSQRGFTSQQIYDFLVQRGYNQQMVVEHINYLQNPQQAQTNLQGSNTATQTQDTSQQSQNTQSGGIKHRNPALVLIFTFITLGIYGIYWLASTTRELKNRSSTAPEPWKIILFVIPFYFLFYYWNYCKALNEVTGFSAGLLFVLWIFVSPIGMVLAQVQLNKA